MFSVGRLEWIGGMELEELLIKLNTKHQNSRGLVLP